MKKNVIMLGIAVAAMFAVACNNNKNAAADTIMEEDTTMFVEAIADTLAAEDTIAVEEPVATTVKTAAKKAVAKAEEKAEEKTVKAANLAIDGKEDVRKVASQLQQGEGQSVENKTELNSKKSARDAFRR